MFYFGKRGKHTTVLFVAIFFWVCSSSSFSQANSSAGLLNSSAMLNCDFSEYDQQASIQAQLSQDLLVVQWFGADDEQLRLFFALEQNTPIVKRLQIRQPGGPWNTVVSDAKIEYKIVEGFRRISNQQLRPLRNLGVELTQNVVDQYKWDVFWDAPLDLSLESRGGNPPPADGVADQPGLPRSGDEIRRADAVYDTQSCRIKTDGARLEVSFPGLQLGSFVGELIVSLYSGTNLIRVEARAATTLPSVAYKYDVAITGLELNQSSSVSWRDVGGQMQSYGLAGPVNNDYVPLRAANRIVVAESNGTAIAAFPPPHTFFWAREVEINVGNNWYRKDSARSFSIGIRQGEQEVVDRYRANWSLYSAPPGSLQKMRGYFYPTLGNSEKAFKAALAFTRADVYKALPGYKVMGSHYHTNLGRELIASGSVDTRLADFEVLRSAGINIAGPVDRPRDESQLQEQYYLFEGAKRHSDDSFIVMPQMENSNLLGGHWDLLFSHPVYYVDERAPGTPLITEHPEYGRMYNIGSAEDIMTMVEAEDMLIYMPHPRTKGSSGYPDAVANTPHFLNDRYRGAGWRWGMGADLSENRLSDFRVIPLLDDMNNWIAESDLQLRDGMAITETYFKKPGDDIYANGPVSYLQMLQLPQPGDYAPIVNALKQGKYFVSSGEVLIPSHSFSAQGDQTVLTAEVEWTFPLDFIEVVYGDGETVRSEIVSTTNVLPFGKQQFKIVFDSTDFIWARFAAWDSAGNGAMTMPIRLAK